MKSLVYLILIALLIAPLSLLADEPTTRQSLLSNSDFMTDDGNGKPAGWPIKDGSITWEKEDDIRFLKLVSPEEGKQVMAYRQLVLPSGELPPALECHVRARYKDVQPGEKAWFDARVMLQWKDKEGKILKPQPPAPNFKGTSNGWVDKSVHFAIPKNAHMLEIMPTLFNVKSGTIEFSRIEILPSTADKLPPPPAMVPSQTIAPPANPLPQLKVVGNKVVDDTGKEVWLQGLSLDSMQWNAVGEHILESVVVATEQWKSNVIRLAIVEEFWFGWGKWQGKDREGANYRKLVDNAINTANARGAYFIIDLHRFGAPNDKHVAFWKDVANRYKNHPGVIFELFNEPHDITWRVWRDGGSTKEKVEDNAVRERAEMNEEEYTPGMQALVNVVREQGANNLILAGGLAWSYDISGIINGYELKDSSEGRGIAYVTHVYPWKKDWQKKFLDVAAKHPVFVTEVGCPEKWEDFSFIKKEEQYEVLGPNCTWPNDMLGVIQKHKLHWTGFSFHPKCGPPVISDWNYTPTPYWGAWVKRALAGEQFTVQRLR